MKKLKLLVVFVFLSFSLIADPPNPNGNGSGDGGPLPGGGAPIGSGVLLIIGMATAYGTKKIWSAENNQKVM